MSTKGSDVESVDLQKDMERKEEELKDRRKELDRLEETVEFRKALKAEKLEMTAPEVEGLSVSSANEDMLNHLPEELLEEISTMNVDTDTKVEHDEDGYVVEPTHPEEEKFQENRELSEDVAAGVDRNTSLFITEDL